MVVIGRVARRSTANRFVRHWAPRKRLRDGVSGMHKYTTVKVRNKKGGSIPRISELIDCVPVLTPPHLHHSGRKSLGDRLSTPIDACRLPNSARFNCRYNGTTNCCKISVGKITTRISNKSLINSSFVSSLLLV